MMIRNVESRNILQGLFNKWQGKDKEVINEAKMENVQTTIMAQPTKLYSLDFRTKHTTKEGRQRINAYFGRVYLCPCYVEEKEMLESDFNYLKNKGYNIIQIKDILGDKYKQQNRGNYSDDEYSFWNEKPRNSFFYRFDKSLERVCVCNNNEKERENIVNDCRFLISQGKPKGEIKKILREKYRKPREYKNPAIPKAPMNWTDQGELLFHGVKTNLTPYNLDVICSLHANYNNPFTFGDYVLQNLPKALPSAVFYLCENYDMIPKLSSEGKKILDKM